MVATMSIASPTNLSSWGGRSQRVRRLNLGGEGFRTMVWVVNECVLSSNGERMTSYTMSKLNGAVGIVFDFWASKVNFNVP